VFGLGGRKTAAPAALLRCSFCNKGEHDVQKLIAGPEVFICDECVAVCVDIIAGTVRSAGAGTLCPICRDVVPFEQIVLLEGGGSLCRACARTIKSTHVQGGG
jgi:hypothetical protein